jgi:UDP-2-acetamido-2-deoxy-ribo-hexuluronate aminotransferase
MWGVKVRFLDLNKQYGLIKKDVNKRIKNVLKHGQYIMGPEIEELESVLSTIVGVKHCICVSSGTDALLIALLALDIRPGDEIITSAFSFISTCEMAALIGAKLVFVDIDAKTYNLNPKLLEAAITPKTKVIVPVNLYGQCADFSEINAIANKYNVPVIEDAAQSFGAKQNQKKSCSLSTIGCTSFFPSKPLGGYGDSGACFTDDEHLARRIKMIRIHGQEYRYQHATVGINGRMDTLQAAILLAKLQIFENELASRIKVAEQYNMLLADICAGPHIANGNISVYAQYTIEVKNRTKFCKILADYDIPTAIHYPLPIYLQTAFKCLDVVEGSFAITEQAARCVVNLPMHPYLESEEIEKVVNVIKIAMGLLDKS